MERFSADEIDQIDAYWRHRPANREGWSGWAFTGDAPDRIWVYRKRAHWRRFPLVKDANGYALLDESNTAITGASSLQEVLNHIETIPGLITAG